ncbi:josephin-2 [Onthophagus taurus]|uniref:josephin-2 n=1 Tax=Onthophagus taurus TaxID=166361 RepID=UPI000C2005CB|nr:josephin-2 [Onthophagus taurus]
MTLSIYHEKQVRELCALHALNNLFQSREFTKEELDQICYSLSPDVWINPHKSVLGLGNYDINVLMKALQSRGYEAIWFDKRKEPTCLKLENIFGFILNVPSDYKLSFITLPLKRRHWVTCRRINVNFYNLDSKLETPEVIGNNENVMEYLQDELEHKDKQLFLVVTEEIARNQLWLNEDFNFLYDNRQSEVVLLGDIKDIISEEVNVTINPLCDSLN